MKMLLIETFFRTGKFSLEPNLKIWGKINILITIITVIIIIRIQRNKVLFHFLHLKSTFPLCYCSTLYCSLSLSISADFNLSHFKNIDLFSL